MPVDQHSDRVPVRAHNQGRVRAALFSSYYPETKSIYQADHKFVLKNRVMEVISLKHLFVDFLL